MKLVLAVITIFIQINVNLSAKCEFRSDTQQLLCRNIDSMNEVANELRPEYVNVAVHNDPSKELYISLNTNTAANYIEELDLRNAGRVTVLDNPGFRPYSSLKRLILTGASLGRIQANWFNSNNKIEHLDISAAGIGSLDASNVSTLKRLRTAVFADNNIELISNNAFDASTRLLTLDFHGNHIKQLNPLGELISLKNLDYSQNAIVEIPADVFAKHDRLETLNIASNFIRNLQSGAFNQLVNLKRLNLSENRISKLQPNVFVTENLQVLDLTNNNIGAIELDTFASLRNLQTLNLSSNPLRALNDHTFNGLTALRNLYLNENDIASLPNNVFRSLRVLERIEMTNNQLTSIDENVFGGELPSLKKLFLRNNNIQSVPKDTFRLTPNIDFLDLSHNALTVIEPNVFSILRRLNKLHFQYNKIEEFPLQAYDDVINVSELKMDHNKLSYLPASNKTFNNLKKVTIEGNPWQCPCFNEIMDFITGKGIEYRLRNNAYFMGKKPLCVITPVTNCVRDINLVRQHHIVDVYELANRGR